MRFGQLHEVLERKRCVVLFGQWVADPGRVIGIVNDIEFPGFARQSDFLAFGFVNGMRFRFSSRNVSKFFLIREPGFQIVWHSPRRLITIEFAPVNRQRTHRSDTNGATPEE